MAVNSLIALNQKSQTALLAYYLNLQATQNVTRDETRARFTKADKEYQREVDKAKEHVQAKAANDRGDTDRIQNITVPIVMPQVETAVTYQSSVFLTGEPIFGVVAGAKYMDAALQLETTISDNAIRGGWTRELVMSFRDGFKYDFAPVEVTWAKEVTATIETSPTKSVTEGVEKKVVWAGNKLRRLDPYNTFVDTRVAPTEVYKCGDFAGYTECKSRIALKTFIAELDEVISHNVTAAFSSGSNTASSATNAGAMFFYEPSINPKVSESAFSEGTNWLQWASLASEDPKRIEYKDSYELTTVYCRILPSEFGLKLPKSNTPQIFKMVIVNHAVIISFTRETNIHNYLPILIGQPAEDGLRYQTKSLAENASPFQAVASSFLNSIMHSRRRAISDRVIYDPSLISPSAINSSNPSAKIPVRGSAYGSKISDSVYAFPYREDQASNSMQQIQSILGLANTLNGQNQASQGQFVKGNKTLQEFESVMDNANGRDQLTAILLESQMFTPMKSIIKSNTLQYQGGTTLYNKDKDQMVEVDPVALRKAVLDFRVTDGLIPASKVLSTDSLGTALQALGANPALGQGYNIAPMFSYLMKTQGANLTEFEKSQEQVAYEQAADNWSKSSQLAIEKERDDLLKMLGPQPKPADFGYDPNKNNPQPEEQQGKPTGKTQQGVLG